jgi:thiol-disulfide isomerase/thioredoxin
MASEPQREQTPAPPRKRNSVLEFLIVVGLAVATSAAVVYWIRDGAGPGRSSEPVGGLAVGERAPPITAAGWLKGEPPGDLSGKVVVVDAWASWCVPCRVQVPKLVMSHRKYHERGVVFIGLTAEDEKELPAVQGFLDENSIPWVNGYGATETLMAFQAEYIPAVWVIGPDGKVVWNVDSEGTVNDGIERALAMRGRDQN